MAALSHGTIDLVKYVIVTFASVDEILWCCQSHEISPPVLSYGTIYLV